MQSLQGRSSITPSTRKTVRGFGIAAVVIGLLILVLNNSGFGSYTTETMPDGSEERVYSGVQGARATWANVLGLVLIIGGIAAIIWSTMTGRDAPAPWVATTAALIRCSQCQLELAAGSNFCNGCGTRIA